MIASTLLFMGYVLDVDFVAYENAGKTHIKWLSQSPQPDDKAIAAAAIEMAAAKQVEDARQVEFDLAREDAKRAIATLDTLIAGIDGATLAQAKTAIKQEAQILRHLILATVGR